METFPSVSRVMLWVLLLGSGLAACGGERGGGLQWGEHEANVTITRRPGCRPQTRLEAAAAKQR